MAGSTGFTRRGALGTTLAVAAIGAQETSVAAERKAPAERVQGIGGFFFRAKDPKAISQWYQTHLGIDPQVWNTDAGPTSFTPFKEDSDYLGDRGHQWMLNFRVRDLDKMAAQLRAAGIAVDVDPQSYPYGRFAHLHDPEGNRLELWQPTGGAP